MQPGCEYHAAGAFRHLAYHFGHIIVQAPVYRLMAFRHIYFLQINPDLVQRQMVFYPFQTFPGCLHLCKIIISSGLCSHDRRDHGGDVHYLPVCHGTDPSGGAAVDMRLTHAHAPGADADQGSVPASSKDRNARRKPQFLRRLRGQGSCPVGRSDDARQMLHLNAEHAAETCAPPFFPFSGVIEQRRECGVFRHDAFSGQPADKILFYIQPLVCPPEVLRFMIFDPFIFPHGIFDAGGHGSGDAQAFQQPEHIGSGDLRTVGKTFPYLSLCPLIHITHRAVHRLPILVHQHQPLHLGAERDPCHFVRSHFCPGKQFFCRIADCLPPFFFILFGSAVFQNIETVSLAHACQQRDRIIHTEQTGFYACRSDIVSQHINHIFIFLPHGEHPPWKM